MEIKEKTGQAVEDPKTITEQGKLLEVTRRLLSAEMNLKTTQEFVDGQQREPFINVEPNSIDDIVYNLLLLSDVILDRTVNLQTKIW